MRIKFQHPYTKSYEKMVFQVGKLIYKKETRLLCFVDVIVFLPFIMGLAFVALTIADWQEEFYDWFESHVMWWLGWGLVGYAFLIEIYATLIRPSIYNLKILRDNKNVTESTTEIEIQSQGLFYKTGMFEGIYRYSFISQVLDMQGYLVMILNGTHFIAVPHTAFDSNEHRQAFYDQLVGKIRDESLSG